jgi:high affinity Mn2+ porin
MLCNTSEHSAIESDANQFRGDPPLTRYSIYAGRFTVTDYFGNNAYYTIHARSSWPGAFRYGIATEPKVANGPQFDRMLFRDDGQTAEIERRYSIRKHPGAVRLLGYANRADAGTYAEALRLAAPTGTPDVVATRRPGTLKYGTRFEPGTGDHARHRNFARLGWSDGKTESFAFTVIDRLASAGVSVKSARLRRKDDTTGTSLTAGGMSGASYLARGGLDFLIGDGRLNYAREYVWES